VAVILDCSKVRPACSLSAGRGLRTRALGARGDGTGRPLGRGPGHDVTEGLQGATDERGHPAATDLHDGPGEQSERRDELRFPVQLAQLDGSGYGGNLTGGGLGVLEGRVGKQSPASSACGRTMATKGSDRGVGSRLHTTVCWGPVPDHANTPMDLADTRALHGPRMVLPCGGFALSRVRS
jgi:hypothetical protein